MPCASPGCAPDGLHSALRCSTCCSWYRAPRTGFSGPSSPKRIETGLANGAGEALLFDLRLVLFSAAAAVALGILLVPTGQRLFAAAITFFQANRSTTKLLLRSVTPAGLSTIRELVAMPSAGTLRSLKGPRGVSWPALIANAAAQGWLAVGALPPPWDQLYHLL